MKDIKNLKPSKNSRFKQGYIDNSKCTKLFESQKHKPIIYRSSYERRFIYWCETNKNILHWASEPFCIEYKIGEEKHHYWPDYLIEMTNGEKILIEIKPEAQTKAPGFIYSTDSEAYKTYVKNMCKWKAANEFCQRNGIKFKVLTEKTINFL